MYGRYDSLSCHCRTSKSSDMQLFISPLYRDNLKLAGIPLLLVRMDPLIKNFQSVYQLGKETAVDESMIAYKGRLSFVQYLSNKPTKWGYTGTHK